MMNSTRIGQFTGEYLFRDILKNGSDLYSDFAKKMEQMEQFLSDVCRGVQSKNINTQLFKDLTEIGIVDFLLVPWFLRIIDYEPLTGRVIYRIRDLIENAMKKYSGENLSLKANTLDLHTQYDVSQGIYMIPVEEFTRYCTKLSGSRYRLTYQVLKDSLVLADEDMMRKVIREACVSFIRERLDLIEKEIALDVFSGYERTMEELSIKAQNIKIETELGPIDTDAFPPCIKHYISDIRNGINLPHMGRFAMVSFLSKVGMKQEDIMAIFGTVPDFSARVTEYQVKHIMGSISGIKYTPPKCETLRSNHLCYMGDDPICALDKVKHPLTYYMEKKKRSRKN